MKYNCDHHHSPKPDCKLFRAISSGHKSRMFADVNVPKHKSRTSGEFDEVLRESLYFGRAVLNKCVFKSLLTASQLQELLIL